MQTLEQPELNETEVDEPKINGFDAGSRSILKEPTLYFSILGLFLISSFALNKTPAIFWTVFLSLSAIAVIFHILAERYIFSTKKENKKFSAPYEGLFVLIFGSVLPGISLLTYSVYSLVNSPPPNILLEIGKIVLLLIVPALNLLVFNSVRRRYIARPRLIGMINGISLGLSASWSIIWLKTCFFSGVAASCKFGWMFLLCVSPFLLLAAILLQVDLCKKTEAKISRIIGAFSVIGIFLSLLFVFTPTVHTLLVQSALDDARNARPADLDQSISFIQSITTPEDLRPSEYPVSGFGLGEMLIGSRGLESERNVDKDLFFRLTGAPYHEPGNKPYDPKTWKPEEVKNVNSIIGAPNPGLSLSRSQIIGSMDAQTMTGSLDWIFTFHNSNSEEIEPSAEIALPVGALVSRATVWLYNKPQEGTVVSTNVPDAKLKTPVLVAMSGKDKVMIKCLPVPAEGERRMRVTFKVPLSTKDGNCSLQIPKIIESNFAQLKRIHVRMASKDQFIDTSSSVLVQEKGTYFFDEIVKKPNPEEAPSCVVSVRQRPDLKPVAVQDLDSKKKQYIVQRLATIQSQGPKHLAIVIDASAQMKPYLPELKKSLSSIPSRLVPKIYFAKTTIPCDGIKSMELKDAQAALEADKFGGGQDNSSVLVEALECSAEKPGSAVLWIHGPQPLLREKLAAPLDIVHAIRLYDFEVQPGPNTLIKALGLGAQNTLGCRYSSVDRKDSVEKDLATLYESWNNPATSVRISRSISETPEGATVISDPALSDQLRCLWAKDEVARLTDFGEIKQAESLAAKYHIVTPITEIVLGLGGAKILDPSIAETKPTRYIAYVGNTAVQLSSPPPVKPTLAGQAWTQHKEITESGGGLVGAPVDPRYGQSNEVGVLADYGYDTARDVSRLVTALSSLISFPLCFGIIFRRKKGELTGATIVKGLALAFGIPTAVHLVGTYMINNFGGLGGGL